MQDREIIARALSEESQTAWREGITRGAERVADAVLAALEASGRVIVPVEAVEPFIRHNSSEHEITITVKTSDVARLRAMTATKGQTDAH